MTAARVGSAQRHSWLGWVSVSVVQELAVQNVRTSCYDKEPTALPAGAAFSCSPEDVTAMFAVMSLQYCPSHTEELTHEGALEQA